MNDDIHDNFTIAPSLEQVQQRFESCVRNGERNAHAFPKIYGRLQLRYRKNIRYATFPRPWVSITPP